MGGSQSDPGWRSRLAVAAQPLLRPEVAQPGHSAAAAAPDAAGATLRSAAVRNQLSAPLSPSPRRTREREREREEGNVE